MAQSDYDRYRLQNEQNALTRDKIALQDKQFENKMWQDQQKIDLKHNELEQKQKALDIKARALVTKVEEKEQELITDYEIAKIKIEADREKHLNQIRADYEIAKGQAHASERTLKLNQEYDYQAHTRNLEANRENLELQLRTQTELSRERTGADLKIAGGNNKTSLEIAGANNRTSLEITKLNNTVTTKNLELQLRTQTELSRERTRADLEISGANNSTSLEIAERNNTATTRNLELQLRTQTALSRERTRADLEISGANNSTSLEIARINRTISNDRAETDLEIAELNNETTTKNLVLQLRSQRELAELNHTQHLEVLGNQDKLQKNELVRNIILDSMKHTFAVDFEKQQRENKIISGAYELIYSEIKALKEHHRKKEIMELEHRHSQEKKSHETDNAIRENYQTELDKAIIRCAEREVSRKGNKDMVAKWTAEAEAEKNKQSS